MNDEMTFGEFARSIKKGDVFAIRDLISSGKDVSARNRYDWTPLMLAAGKGNTAIVQLLLSKGADVGAINRFGVSALACAALEGECRAIQVLLHAGAPLDVRPHGVSLREFAKWGGSVGTERHFTILRAAGAV